MTKRYSTTYSNGVTVETSSPHEAWNFVKYDNAQTFALSGKLVEWQKFYSEAYFAREKEYTKKTEIHKRVKVLHGASAASHVTKWVRK